MAINLPDLRTATAAAIDSATATVSAPIPDVPGTINPNEEFTYSVTASNTAVGAVRLINVTYHVQASPLTVALLKVPASPPARLSADPTGSTLAVGTLVSGMFLFPTDNSLDVGDTDTISGLKGKGMALGNFSITCHIHGDVDLDYLFPKGEIGLSGSTSGAVV